MKKSKKNAYVSCIVAAGGKGTRMGADINKIFLDLCDIPVIAHTLKVLNDCELINEIIIVTAECDLPGCNDIVTEFDFDKVKTITVGGKERQDSVESGILEVSQNADIVMVHDGARPLVTDEKLIEVINAAKEYGAAALGVPEKNTLKQVDENGFIVKTIDRSNVYAIHTPQVFTKNIIESIYKNAKRHGISATDDCYLAEIADVQIKMVTDSYENIKITTQDDLIIAQQILINR